MTQTKKYLARSYFFLMYQFLRHKYENIEVVFISHTVNAKQVTEDEFFKRISIGGTMMSSALELTKETIDKQYHPESWNIYTFYCGDGENWIDDNAKTIQLFKILKKINQLMVYAEIKERPEEELDGDDTITNWHSPNFTAWQEENMHDSMWTLSTQLMDDKFKKVLISGPNQIWSAFKKIFGAKNS